MIRAVTCISGSWVYWCGRQAQRGCREERPESSFVRQQGSPLLLVNWSHHLDPFGNIWEEFLDRWVEFSCQWCTGACSKVPERGGATLWHLETFRILSRQGGKSTCNRETCETDEHQQVASKSLEEELRICFDPIENRASILEVNADGPEGLIFLEHCALTALYCFSMRRSRPVARQIYDKCQTMQI